MKNWASFCHFFFTYHSQKYFTKAFFYLLQKFLIKAFYYLLLLLPLIIDLSYPKVPCKSVLLSSKNVALRKLTSLIIPKSVFYYVKFPLNVQNKPTKKQQTFCKTWCKLIKTFCIYKITVNSPKFNNTKNWRVTVND